VKPNKRVGDVPMEETTGIKDLVRGGGRNVQGGLMKKKALRGGKGTDPWHFIRKVNLGGKWGGKKARIKRKDLSQKEEGEKWARGGT